MKIPFRKCSLIAITCCVIVFAAFLTLNSLDAQSRRAPAPSKVKVGEMAPDFELPFISFSENKEGKPIGVLSKKDTFKLSSFRNKKPVCMLMSSYT